MKKRVANRALVVLIFIVSVGLFQAWKESRNPFAFFKNKQTIEKSNIYTRLSKPIFVR